MQVPVAIMGKIQTRYLQVSQLLAQHLSDLPQMVLLDYLRETSGVLLGPPSEVRSDLPGHGDDMSECILNTPPD